MWDSQVVPDLIVNVAAFTNHTNIYNFLKIEVIKFLIGVQTM